MVPSTFLQVCGVTQGGGFAGEVIIKEGGVVKLPTHVDLIAAAGLPVIFGTAHLAIKERAQVKPGPLTHHCMSTIGAFEGASCNAHQSQLHDSLLYIWCAAFCGVVPSCACLRTSCLPARLPADCLVLNLILS